MNRSINIIVVKIRHGLSLVAVILAMIAGLAGHFLEFNHLEVNQVVEQIHATLERREEIKELNPCTSCRAGR